jgi:hypothetical protein
MIATLLALVLAQPIQGWRESDKHQGEWLYYREGAVTHCYLAGSGQYFPLAAGSWGEGTARKPDGLPEPPPLAAKTPAKAPVKQEPDKPKEADPTNYGVDLSKIATFPKYTINGQEIGRQEAMDAVSSGKLPDDRKLLRLTVIGSDPECQRVVADLDADPATRAQVVVQCYAPNDCAVARYGFKCDGKPSIYLQSPDGVVLHRQADYADGPAGLATAIRKAAEGYDPSKDPDLRRALQVPGLGVLPAWAWVIGAVGILLIFKRGGVS